MGEVDDSNALSWLDVVEARAVEIGDAVVAELVKQQTERRPVEEGESVCPQCSGPGRCPGRRERPLLTRRGPTTIVEPQDHCRCCRKVFFPMTNANGVEVECPFTPAVLQKVVYAGTQAAFAQATKDLAAMAELDVSRERVQRWTKRVGRQRVGRQRVDEVEQQTQADQQLPLPERQKSPRGQVPQVACVQMDGGRIQIRDRREDASQREGEGCRRESLVGCCLSMSSPEHANDPCPTIPAAFVDPARMNELSREIKRFSGDPEAAEGPPEDAPDDRDEKPRVLVQSVVATRKGAATFGRRSAAQAHARGFHAARRKAFVADRSSSNWGVHRKHFSHYTPILDFTHAVCYVYAAATAGRRSEAAWRDHCQWAQWL